MAEQQALALALWDLGERASDGGAILFTNDETGRTGELIFERFFVGAFESANALQSGPGAPGRTQPIEGQVEPDAPQPGAHFAVRLRLQVRRVGELEKRFLQGVLGLHAVAEDAVHQTEQLGIKLREQTVESREAR